MQLKRYLPVTILIGLIVFTMSFATTLALAGSAQPQPSDSPPKPIELTREAFDEWQYTAYREGKNVMLDIALNDTSKAGLEAFRIANQHLAYSLVERRKSLNVSIVLNKPISVGEFIALANKYRVQVSQFEMRVIDGHGGRVTLFSSPKDDRLVSDFFIQSMLQWIQEETGEAKFMGVTTIEASLPVSSYDALSADPLVFMVDVTSTFAEQHLRQKQATQLNADDFIIVSTYPIYWYLENNQ